jgi:AraC-like DNA-binding protein
VREVPRQPWILHGRSYAAREHGGFEGPGISRSLGLWWLREGVLRHVSADGEQRRLPGAVFFTDPGDRIHYPRGARFGFLHFELFGRRIVPADRNAYAVAADDARQHPPLAALLGDHLAQPLSPPQCAVGRELLLELLAMWWRSPLEHWCASQRLGAWLSQLALPPADPDDPQALAKLYRQRCAQRTCLMSTVNELRRSLGVSRPQLQRACREAFGCTPAEVLEQERIRMARGLLRDGAHYDLETIAFTLGYSDRTSFSRSFRRETGIPPGAYRDAR